MKKIIILGSVLAIGMLMGAPEAKAEIVTSTPTLVAATLKAANSTGQVAKGCIVNAGAASNTFYFYDGTTLKFMVSVATATSYTVDFQEILKEEWNFTGAFKVKAAVEDALGFVTCTTVPKRVN
jgi:hypothetical protein